MVENAKVSFMFPRKPHQNMGKSMTNQDRFSTLAGTDQGTMCFNHAGSQHTTLDHTSKVGTYCTEIGGKQSKITKIFSLTLTHWGRVTRICISKLTIIGSDNGLSSDRRQAIIWTNAKLFLIGPLGTNFSEILIEILTFSFKKMRLKVSSAKRRPFCLGLNELIRHGGHVNISHGCLLECNPGKDWNMFIQPPTPWFKENKIIIFQVLVPKQRSN